MSYNPYSSPDSGLSVQGPVGDNNFKLRLFGPVEIGVCSFFGFSASIGFMFFVNYRAINENAKSWIVLMSGLLFPVLLTIFSGKFDVYFLVILVLFIDVSCAIGSWILFKK